MFGVTKTLTSRAIIEGEYEKLTEMGDEVARQIESTILDASSDLGALAGTPILLDAQESVENKQGVFNRLVRHYDGFYDITLLDIYGYAVVSSNPDHVGMRDQTSWFQDAVEGKSNVSPPVVAFWPEGFESKPHLRLYFTVYIPIALENATPHSVVKARVRFDRIWDILDEAKIGDSGEFFLLDEHGNYLAHWDRNRVMSKHSIEPVSGWADDATSKDVSGYYEDDEGNEQMFVTRSIVPEVQGSNQKWLLFCQVSKAEANAMISENLLYQLGAVAVTLVIAYILAVFLTKVLAGPVVEASRIAREVADGSMTSAMPVKGPEEMRFLATSFNSMIDEVRTHRYHLEQLVDSRTRRLRRSQQDLEELSAQLKATYESTPEGVLVMKSDGTILTVNQRLTDIFGFKEKPAEMLYTDFEEALCNCFEDKNKFRELWERTENDDHKLVNDEEWELKKPNAGTIQVYAAPVRNAKGEVFARLWMFQDITEQKQLEKGLQQAQKMEAIGRLAGGVAHDFNNLLTGIIGNLQLVEMSPGRESADGEENSVRCIRAAKKAGQRAADLVKQLLGFSRQTHLALSSADANEVITDANDLLRASLNPKISVEMNLSGDLWGVNIDSTQMEQVVMNMCVNSSDAIADTGERGTIVLKTRNRTIEESEVDFVKGERAGDFVVISISDDGAGIPQNVLENIFEPFFTTKEQGKGTGLGLATSFGIVQQHGGWIHCSSVIDEGTKFEIYLPRQDVKTVAVVEKNEDGEIVGGNETILLVDDEDIVRSVAAGILSHYGYNILHATDGLKAMEIMNARGSEIDLVLLDRTMPNLTGDETFARIRQEVGDVPVVVCSGYVVDLDEFGELAECRPQGFVQKPYALRDLALQVRDVMDRHAVVTS